MRPTSFIAFLALAVIAPGLAYLAAENLPPLIAVAVGAALGAITIVFALWLAYRDSMPRPTQRYEEEASNED